MAITFDELVGQKKVIDPRRSAFEGTPLKLVYNPGWFTPDRHVEIDNVRKEQGTDAEILYLITGCLVEWDVTRTVERNGKRVQEMLPITEEVLRSLPDDFILHVLRCIRDTQNGKPIEEPKPDGEPEVSEGESSAGEPSNT